MEYEICYLIGEAKEANLDKIRKDIEKTITDNKGSLLEGELVKKRRLAYEIDKESRGTYVAKRFTLPEKDERDEKYPGKDFISEITRDLNFNQDLLRFIIVKADELPTLKESEELENQASEEKKDGRRDFKKDTKTKGKIVTPAKKGPIKNEPVKAKEVDEKEEIKKEKIKESSKVEEKKEPKKEASKKGPKDEKKDDISEDNIDEKLDEILNI